jgi:microcystin-dependent protein
MSNPFIGEIRMFPGNFAPLGWAFCDGSLQSIADNTTLFSLLGTTYGGDGQSTFALPDLRSRVPIHQGPGFVIGQNGGAEQVTLTVPQLPSHTHVLQGQSAAATQTDPTGNVWAAGQQVKQFNAPDPNASMSPSVLGLAGGSQPHDNMLPFVTINFIISLFGIYPSQN